MASAVQIRYQVEGALAKRYPTALRPAARAVRPVCSTGVETVDALLEGGLPVGAISELTGPACSGRVSLALSYVAKQTRDGQVCAWIDGADGFDPESAAGSGVELDRLLWVRCGGGADPGNRQAQAATATPAGTQYAVARTRETGTVCGGMHPRTEAPGMAEALGGWLLGGPVRDSVRMSGKPGTPGAVNRPLTRTETGAGQVQVPTDRVPARRGEHALDQKSRLVAGETGAIAAATAEPYGADGLLVAKAKEYARVAPRCTETQQGLHRANKAGVSVMPATVLTARPTLKATGAQAGVPGQERPDSKPRWNRRQTQWDRMDQVIQTTDLLLQGSGFACIVMDLSGVEARYAHRIPLATWFRFRAAADRTRTSLLVLTQHPCTGSSGEVMLRMRAAKPTGTTVITGVPLHVEVVRQRFTGQRNMPGNVLSIRKPPRAATEGLWCAPARSCEW